MGKRYFLSFSTAEYRRTQELAVAFALAHGLDTSFTFNETSLKQHFPDFVRSHEAFLTQRGYGYWIWKPFLVSWILDRLSAGDILMYADSGMLFTEDPSILFAIADRQEQLFFAAPGMINKRWVKRDVFVALDADCTECWESEQLLGGLHLWRAGPSSSLRAREWSKACQQYHLINDEPSTALNLPEFQDHRHDQSVLSVLAWKWGVRLELAPTQSGADDKKRRVGALYGGLALSVGSIERQGEIGPLWGQIIEPAMRRLKLIS